MPPPSNVVKPHELASDQEKVKYWCDCALQAEARLAEHDRQNIPSWTSVGRPSLRSNGQETPLDVQAVPEYELDLFENHLEPSMQADMTQVIMIDKDTRILSFHGRPDLRWLNSLS